jgi:hypothetical protein
MSGANTPATRDRLFGELQVIALEHLLREYGVCFLRTRYSVLFTATLSPTLRT